MGVETEQPAKANGTGYRVRGLIFHVDGGQGQRSHAHWERVVNYPILQMKD